MLLTIVTKFDHIEEKNMKIHQFDSNNESLEKIRFGSQRRRFSQGWACAKGKGSQNNPKHPASQSGPFILCLAPSSAANNPTPISIISPWLVLLYTTP
jgi:hypothetical protein